MLTNKDYCDYEIVLELKELGYDYIRREGLIHLYDAQKWLREKGIFVHISHPLRVENDVFWNYEVLDEAWDDGKQNPCIYASGGLFDSYEDTLQKGIEMAVRILKEESNDRTSNNVQGCLR